MLECSFRNYVVVVRISLLSDNEFEFYEESAKVIRYINYLKTSIDFNKVIIFVKKSDFM